MKLRDTNHIELSVANLRALYQEVERGAQSPTIYKTVDGQVIAVSVAQDVEHYSTDQLERRTSPFLAPECWAGVP